MNSSDVELVENSIEMVFRDKNEFSRWFYERFFEMAPEAQPMFDGNMKKQREMLFAFMAMSVKGLKDRQRLRNSLAEMGMKHANLGVTKDQYAAFSNAFLDALRFFLGDALDLRLVRAWRLAFAVITTEMEMATAKPPERVALFRSARPSGPTPVT